MLHERRLDVPVLLGLQLTVRGDGARVGIVDECHAVTDEDVVFDGHPFADERMAGNLAVVADLRILLDLDERADFRVVTHFTAVQVDEFRQPDTRTQLHVGSDTLIVVHSWMTLPLSLRDWSAASRSLTTREPATPSLSGVRFRVTQSMK